jgi:hypothetical protein
MIFSYLITLFVSTLFFGFLLPSLALKMGFFFATLKNPQMTAIMALNIFITILFFYSFSSVLLPTVALMIIFSHRTEFYSTLRMLPGSVD